MQNGKYKRNRFFNKHRWVLRTLLFAGLNILILTAGLMLGSMLYLGQ